MPTMNLKRVRDYGNPDGASTVLNTTNDSYMSGNWVESDFQLIRILPADYKHKPYEVGKNLFDPHNKLPGYGI